MFFFVLLCVFPQSPPSVLPSHALTAHKFMFMNVFINNFNPKKLIKIMLLEDSRVSGKNRVSLPA